MQALDAKLAHVTNVSSNEITGKKSQQIEIIFIILSRVINVNFYGFSCRIVDRSNKVQRRRRKKNSPHFFNS
jgi:hypothetical protein